MKLLNIALIVITALLMTSCSKDDDTTLAQTDFKGIYDGILSCSEGFELDQGDNVTLIVTQLNDTSYLINMGDDIIVEAVSTGNNILSIPSQRIGEGQSFDNFTIEGKLELVDEIFMFSVEVDSDTDEEGVCNFEVEKR